MTFAKVVQKNFIQREFGQNKEIYAQENSIKTNLRPFFQTKSSVIKNYVYYDNPIFITAD